MKSLLFQCLSLIILVAVILLLSAEELLQEFQSFLQIVVSQLLLRKISICSDSETGFLMSLLTNLILNHSRRSR